MNKIKIIILLFFLLAFYTANINALENDSINSKIMNGKHQIKDEVGNVYYYSTSADYSEYGDFRANYKNGEVYKIKYNDEVLEDTAYFITLANPLDEVKGNTVIFCIEPEKEAINIDNTNPEESAYNNLSEDVQIRLGEIVSTSINLFSATGNYDYLVACQMLVWEAVGSEILEMPASIEEEVSTIRQGLEEYYELPSFISNDGSSNFELTYNKDNGRYEVYLQDENEVLDDKYLAKLVSQGDNYTIEDGPGINDLYIWTESELEPTNISIDYSSMPEDPGIRSGVNYVVDPLFINSGQDLVSGITSKINLNFNISTKQITGNLKVIKKDSETDDYLEGVEFSLYKDINNNGLEDAEDELIDVYLTDENGEIYLTDLPSGNYLLKETKALEGYVLDDTVYTISIDGSQEEYLIEVYNKKAYEKVIETLVNTSTNKKVFQFILGILVFIIGWQLIKYIVKDNNYI